MKIKSVSNYMAILRNLNNILKVGVSKTHVEMVCAALTDPVAIRKSRQYPFRYYSAFRALKEAPFSFEEAPKALQLITGLNNALELSIQNIPRIPGKTLVLVDVSGSMTCETISKNSSITPADIAGLFAAISSKICDDADVVAFATKFGGVRFEDGEKTLARMDKLTYVNVGVVTNAHLPMEYARQMKVKYDRVILLSDMQCYYHIRSSMNSFAQSFYAYQREVSPAYLYTIDLTGYGTAQVPQYNDKVLMLAGFSEKLFEFIPRFESEKVSLVEEVEGYKI